MKKKTVTISPVERAVLAQKWRKSAVNARIHALLGDDSKELVRLSGRMFFVAAGAVKLAEIPKDDVDVRILRGAVNAMAEQAGEPEIPEVRRRAIDIGLQAVGRIVDRVGHEVVTLAACVLELKLRSGHIKHIDFLELLEAA